MSELTPTELANAHQTEEYQSKLAKVVDHPTFINQVCDFVANGGTLCTLSEMWGVRYSDLCSFIHGREALSKRYVKALNDRSEWSKERVLHELRLLALSDVRKAYNPDGTLKPIQDIPEEAARAIQAVEVDELFQGQGAERELVGYTRKVKFWDKTKAIELTAKNLGLFIDRHEVNGSLTLEDLVSRAQAVDVESVVTRGVNVVDATLASESDEKKSE